MDSGRFHLTVHFTIGSAHATGPCLGRPTTSGVTESICAMALSRLGKKISTLLTQLSRNRTSSWRWWA